MTTVFATEIEEGDDEADIDAEQAVDADGLGADAR